jgi:phospholipid transport system substrate-binding protein
MVNGHCRIGFAAISLVLILLFSVQPVFASEITKSVKSTIDEVINIVTDENLKTQKSTRREKIRQAIGKRFNFHQMVMRSLAKDWKDRTPQEQKEFQDLFKRLLENSYASKIESYSDEKINYSDEIVKGNYALVKTEIVRKDSTIEVDYKLIKNNGEWMVYDFVIEGVSMIRNYRSQFSKIIRKDSYEVLVQKLSDKIQEIEDGNGNSDSEQL